MQRFSLFSLFLLTALVALAISHVLTSLEANRLKNELAVAKSELKMVVEELCVINSTEPDKLYAVALPGNHETQWKWRIQFPVNGKYRLRSFFGDTPASGYPSDAAIHDDIFQDNSSQQLYNADSVLLTGGLHFLASGECKLSFSTPDNHQSTTIDNLPPWSGQFQRMTKMTQGLSPTHTVSSDENEPLQLLRIRKTKSAGGVHASDPAPAAGFMLWIERIPN